MVSPSFKVPPTTRCVKLHSMQTNTPTKAHSAHKIQCYERRSYSFLFVSFDRWFVWLVHTDYCCNGEQDFSYIKTFIFLVYTQCHLRSFRAPTSTIPCIFLYERKLPHSLTSWPQSKKFERNYDSAEQQASKLAKSNQRSFESKQHSTQPI